MWIITKDFVDDGKMAGTGSRGTSDKSTVGVGGEMPFKFRILDGDDIVYYSGYNSEQNFDPLDDFAEGYAGCTSIEYMTEKGWEVL